MKVTERQMPRVFNFSPGPGMLPDPVLRTVKNDLLDWHGCGMSVLEMSHRSPEFGSIIKTAEAGLRELLGIPPNYHVLFLQGGSHLQFSMVPLNLLGNRDHADYVNTGYWSERAMSDARQYCHVNIAASLGSNDSQAIPGIEAWTLDASAAYVHYVSNDTATGIEFSWIPDCGAVPLVADMSTNLLTKPVDIGRHAVIYACAQKNIGIAGLTIVIIHEDLIGNALPFTPRMLNYKCHVDAASMFNTPCTFAIYAAGLMVDWIRKEGGLVVMDQRHREMSAMLYEFLDHSVLFTNRVVERDRSRINVPFSLEQPELEEPFLEFALARGLRNLRGNLGLGLRASMYNAMPKEGIERLVDAMSDFEKSHA